MNDRIYFPITGTNTEFDNYCREHGLTKEDVVLMGLRAGDWKLSEQMIGQYMNECFHIPYMDEPDYAGRCRNLTDIGAKYLSAKGSGHSPPYWSPNVERWDKVRKDPKIPLGIVEGEVEAYVSNKHIQKQDQSEVIIGIGGVDMIANLFNRDIVWKGRPVYLAFDKDAGHLPGTFAPRVSNALGRLSAKLQSLGAIVLWVAVPGKEWDKVGLGDYLRSGGDWAAIRNIATPPPMWCEAMAEMLETCVLVTGTDRTHVYSLTEGWRKTVDDFHTAYIRETIIDSEGKIKQLSRMWLRHPDRMTAKVYAMNPRLPFGITGRDINLWRPYPTFEGELVPDVTKGWQKFMDGLFGEWSGWVGAWVGHMLERPWEKAHQGVLVVTKVRGIGKSLFLRAPNAQRDVILRTNVKVENTTPCKKLPAPPTQPSSSPPFRSRSPAWLPPPVSPACCRANRPRNRR